MIESGAKSVEVTPSGTPSGMPEFITLKTAIQCNVCMGAVKPNWRIVKCGCGKKYHDSCAKRTKHCPSCNTDFSGMFKAEEDAKKKAETETKAKAEAEADTDEFELDFELEDVDKATNENGEALDFDLELDLDF